MAYQDIADTLGISIGTVESRLFRARARFKLKLSQLYPNSPRPESPDRSTTRIHHELSERPTADSGLPRRRDLRGPSRSAPQAPDELCGVPGDRPGRQVPEAVVRRRRAARSAAGFRLTRGPARVRGRHRRACVGRAADRRGARARNAPALVRPAHDRDRRRRAHRALDRHPHSRLAVDRRAARGRRVERAGSRAARRAQRSRGQGRGTEGESK